MAIQIKRAGEESDGFQLEVDGVDWQPITKEEAQALVDQLADMEVFATKAANAIQSLHQQNTQLRQQVAPPELLFLRNLVTAAIMKGAAHG